MRPWLQGGWTPLVIGLMRADRPLDDLELKSQYFDCTTSVRCPEPFPSSLNEILASEILLPVWYQTGSSKLSASFRHCTGGPKKQYRCQRQKRKSSWPGPPKHFDSLAGPTGIGGCNCGECVRVACVDRATPITLSVASRNSSTICKLALHSINRLVQNIVPAYIVLTSCTVCCIKYIIL